MTDTVTESFTIDDVTLEAVSCPLCEANEPSPYCRGQDVLWKMPGEFQYVRCRKCRHIYLNPRPTIESIHRYYPEHYTPYHLQEEQETPCGDVKRQHQPWYLSSPVRMIPGLRSLYRWLAQNDGVFIPDVENESPRGLEIGCAGGEFLVRLRDAGWDAQGVELSKKPAEIAMQRGFPVHIGTLESANLPDNQFDAVFAWMVIEHLHDPLSSLREIRRLLKPNGWLAFSVPNIGCWEPWVFGRYWYSLQPPTHLQHFTPRSVRTMLDASGFVPVHLIHQRNMRNVIGSLGILFSESFPKGKLGPRLLDLAVDSGMWGELAMSPLAKVASLLGQGGRLTVVARKRS